MNQVFEERLHVAYVHIGAQDLAAEVSSIEPSSSVMGLFNRKKRQDTDSAESSDNKKEKGSWKRPASLSLSPCLLLNL